MKRNKDQSTKKVRTELQDAITPKSSKVHNPYFPKISNPCFVKVGSGGRSEGVTQVHRIEVARVEMKKKW